MYFQPQLNHKPTRHKRKTRTLEFLTIFFSTKILGVKHIQHTHENQTMNSPLPPGGVPTVAPAQQQSKWLLKDVHGAFFKPLLPNVSTTQFLQSHLAPARRRVSERSLQVWSCVRVCCSRAGWWCLWYTENMRPPLIGGHVAANISAGRWDQCFLSWRASVSSLSLVLGQRLFFFSSRRHSSATTVPQQSHNNPTLPPTAAPLFSLV